VGLAVARIDLVALDHALFLPEGYHIKAVQQEQFQTMLALLIESDALPKAEEGKELPEATLLVTVHTMGEQRDYRKYTTEVRIQDAW